MSGETSAIAEIADKVSKEIFKWFKWERVILKDQNFDCLKEKHAPRKTRKHTHPVDIVFKYDDPYLETSVLLNTDLKSYSSTSISPSIIRKNLKSIAQTIDCARVSDEWRSRYDTSGNGEIRGLLFVYNHDGQYDTSFISQLNTSKAKTDTNEENKGVNVDSLPLERGQLIHIIEPTTIAFLTTVIADINRMHKEGSFPVVNYYFLYPELQLHRTRVDKYKRPATVELISGPFFVVGHDPVCKYDETSQTTKETYPEGYVVFYNRPGNSYFEFMYLFDVLSSYQILDKDKHIRIRVAHDSPNPNLKGNFKKAIEMYIIDWNFDDYKREILEDIEVDIVEIHKTCFSSIDIGWERK